MGSSGAGPTWTDIAKLHERKPLRNCVFGVLRHALSGENVDVGDEWLDDFDAINCPEQQKKAPAPKKAAPKRKT